MWNRIPVLGVAMMVLVAASACSAGPGDALTAQALRDAQALVRDVEVACGADCQPAEQARHLASDVRSPDTVAGTGENRPGWDVTSTVTLQLHPTTDAGGFTSGTVTGVRCVEVTFEPGDDRTGTSVNAALDAVGC